ncbi:MAG TPA: Holliday junction resolvase RuvX [Candidatus Saccharimonadales bacterium]|nr:Holliday junction resolvase RuvX [Candidatus Saccharimonadales bacterium]
MPQTPSSHYLALDVGAARVGLAIASTEARLARPLTTLKNDESIFAKLKELISESKVNRLVIGLPRGLEGQETEQTSQVRQFASELKTSLVLPIHFQDEAVTSIRAEEELKARGRPYNKEDVDALSATYILEDFLQQGDNNEIFT